MPSRANRQVEARADQDLVDGASLADLLASRAAVTDDLHASGYQYLRIAALFRIDPHAADEAARRIRATTSLDEVQVLAGALGDSGAPAAQTALGALARDSSLDGGRRGQAVIALGLAPSPTADALAALRAVVAGPPGELADAAWLALGNLALRLRPADPATASEIVDELIAALGTGGTEDLRATLARALGNTGDPRIVPALAPLTRDPADDVRAAALGSLRMVPTPQATQLLLAGLADPASLARAAAVFAIGHHPQAPYAAVLVARYARDAIAGVRREILVVAATYAAELPGYRELLVRASTTDPDAELRAIAARALAEV